MSSLHLYHRKGFALPCKTHDWRRVYDGTPFYWACSGCYGVVEYTGESNAESYLAYSMLIVPNDHKELLEFVCNKTKGDE